MHEQHISRRLAHWLATLLAVLALIAQPTPAKAEQAPTADDPFAVAPALGLEEGTYTVTVSLEGGSGRASITSPTTLTVKEGKAVATIIWSSPNYDYMIVADRRFLPQNEDGNSVFEIPVLALDEPFEVVGDTTAMSEPHEITYELMFSTESLSRQVVSWSHARPLGIGVVLAAAAALGLVRIRRRRQQA